jgi:glutathione synthase/RimK-type ligase-like ATP-grasp enzyme
VVKAPGGEGGVGVLRADGPEALFGLVDLLVRGQGTLPWLSAYVPGAMHHRVIVVGDRAVCSYENPVRERDFRSSPSDDPAAYTTDVPEGLARIALAAARAERVFFAGVDVLVHPDRPTLRARGELPLLLPHATLVAASTSPAPWSTSS